MSVEPGSGGMDVAKVETEEVEVRVVDLGDVMFETRQGPGNETPDCAWVLSTYPSC